MLDLSEVAAQVLGEVRGAPAEADEDDDAPLLADESTASMRDSLAALAMLSAPGAAPQIVRSGETSRHKILELAGDAKDLTARLAQWLA